MCNSAASNEFTVPQTVGDVCPGDVLMYNCTINGAGSTIWSGSAFDCEMRNDEIILRHSQFESGSSGNCNDGAVTAQSLGVVDNTCFSSQLSVTVNLEMNNKTVQCAHSTTIITPIGVGIISVATGESILWEWVCFTCRFVCMLYVLAQSYYYACS